MADAPKSILLVDDDKFLLDMYSLKFKNSGLEVDTARNGNEALKKLEDGAAPNIILLDIIMPGMDGIDFLKEVKANKLALNSIIVMLTNQADDEAKTRELGAAGFILKATSIPSEVVKKVFEIYNEKK